MKSTPTGSGRPVEQDARLGDRDARLRLSRVGAPAGGGSRRDALEVFRCPSCGEAIGVYEPLVACRGKGARVTSRAAEPGLRTREGTYYHRDCYAALGDPPARPSTAAD